MIQPPPIVLSFSANDPSGGAGIHADILTIASLGCHPVSAITAITVQDTAGIEDILAIDPEFVADQARAVLEDMPVHVFKTGLLGSVEIIAVIAEIISDYPDIPFVMDPVLASGRGDEIANEEMVHAMQELLIPQATIITPNSLEARRIAQHEVDDDQELELKQCAEILLQSGCEYVLITGTHENTSRVVNTLYGADGVLRSDEWQRLSGSYHGSGCTLASALAASIANGLTIYDSVYEAQRFTWQTLKAGFRPGMGQYLPDRLFWAIEDTEADKN